MQLLTLVSVLIAILGLAFTATAIRRLIQRRFLRAAGLQFSGLMFLLLASSAFLLASNLYTYQRLVYEQAIAEITFGKINPPPTTEKSWIRPASRSQPFFESETIF